MASLKHLWGDPEQVGFYPGNAVYFIAKKDNAKSISYFLSLPKLDFSQFCEAVEIL